MNFSFDDASRLLGLAAARDQRTVGRADILAWQADLNAAGLTPADAEQALSAFYQEMSSREYSDRYRVTPVDVLDIARRARRERVTNLRYDGDPDETPQQYLARLRARTKAVADGRISPDEGLRALGPGTPDPRLLALPVGSQVPDDGVPGSGRPTRTGPLTVPCPACGARLGQPCRAAARLRSSPHASRRRAAREEHGQQQEDSTTLDARRAAAVEALQRLSDTERAELDAFQQRLGDAS